MLFNSASFLIFFPAVGILFFILPSRMQWFVLLLASAYFYMSFVPKYILVLLFLIVVDFCLGILIEKREGHSRKVMLIISIICNLGALFVFKYFNFFNANVSMLAHAIGWNYSIGSLQLILPLGLSFHVFQSLSYVIEVYRKKYLAERHLGIYALYVLFFPQLVAGPIERPQQLLPQLHTEQKFNYELMMDGLTLMLWGFFKKMVIADQLAIIVDQVYGNLFTAPPAAIVIALPLFAYQLYCDFSGYSDIAVGAARVFGFELVINFNRPYASRSIAEFWRRWHISLSSWLRDYLFNPIALGFGRATRGKLYFATFITFVLIGLWHGANWTFVSMGALFGMYIVVGQMTNTMREHIVTTVGLNRFPCFHAVLQVLFTFSLVSLTWVFFRAPNMHDAFYVITQVPQGIIQLFDVTSMQNSVLTISTLGITLPFLLLRLVAIIFMEQTERFAGSSSTLRIMLLRWPFSVRVGAYYGLVTWIFLLGYFGARSFIYFQF